MQSGEAAASEATRNLAYNYIYNIMIIFSPLFRGDVLKRIFCEML